MKEEVTEDILIIRVSQNERQKVGEAQALSLLHEALLYSAEHLKRRSLSLESLEYVAMDEAARWVEHLAEAAKSANFLLFFSESLKK